ncbi:MAG: hypothetical protein ACTSRR_10310 [Candidatus Heimdallarchaeaceae archaeon]
MSVLIKNVKKELYARFKAKAAMKGLKLSEAFEEAMLKWINEDDPQTEEDKERALNNATLRRLRAELIKEHENEWVVISSGKLIGIYPNREKAIKAIRENNLEGKCNIVTPVKPLRRKVSIRYRRKE